MSDRNSFLSEFMKMRKELNPGITKVSNAQQAPPKKDKASKKQEVKNPGLGHIIEKKPHKRIVIEHLQDRANALTVEKMK
jgi:hypothetical protein